MTRNEMFDAMEHAQELNPDADMAMVAVGLGADRAYFVNDVLQVVMPNGDAFAFTPFTE